MAEKRGGMRPKQRGRHLAKGFPSWAACGKTREACMGGLERPAAITTVVYNNSNSGNGLILFNAGAVESDCPCY